MISLAGRWSLPQIRALCEAGWLDGMVVVEITNQNQACRWFYVFDVKIK